MNPILTWSETTLGECARWFSGGTPRTSEQNYWNGDIPWISSGSLTSFYIRDSERRVTQAGLENGTRLVPEATVIFVVRGMSLKTEFRIGITKRPVAFGQDCKALVAKPVILPEFLANVLRSKTPEILAMVEEAGHGTGTLPTDSMKALRVPLPPLDEQRRILRLVTALDELIALLSQTNTTLDAIAQTIFESWFLNFDPVHAKSSGFEPDAMDIKTATLFPSEFEDSNVGQIPKGWTVSKVGRILERLPVKARFGKNDVSPFGRTPVYEQGARILLGYHDEQGHFGATGEEPMFIFGDHTCVTRLAYEPFDISQNVIPLKGKGRPTAWVYYAIRNKQTFQEYRRHWMELVAKDVVVAPVAVCTAFAKLVQPLHAKLESNLRLATQLAALRDELLPRLISGQLRIPDAEKALEEAL